MRVLVHDFSGHPFQVELSRELARRGHDVTHSSCDAYVSGKGDLHAGPGESLSFQTIGRGITLDKSNLLKRLVAEVRLGVQLARHVRTVRPDVALMSNVQIATLSIFALAMLVTRTRWVLWHQDLYAVAMRSFVGDKLPRLFGPVAAVFEVAERWCAKRAAAVVVIDPSFVPVHEQWGTADRTVVIPNWAPLDKIVPVERHNAWSGEQDLDDRPTLLYAGTLGMKHDPVLLVRLAARVAERGREVRLVVVNEGEATTVLREESARLGVDLRLLPFQPFDRLAEVLGTGDLLVVLLENEAGTFSVPSKTLSYLCAGRPIVGLMPVVNSAARLVGSTGGFVAAPREENLDDAADYVVALLDDDDRRRDVGTRSRELAEREFDLQVLADRFETVLEQSRDQARPIGTVR